MPNTQEARIYDQHDAAFAHVSAFVVVKDGARVATVAFKFPRDGAGRLYAYVHWIGAQMVRGFAAGGGYDKKTAACADATRKQRLTYKVGEDGEGRYQSYEPAGAEAAFWHALSLNGGRDWDRALRDAGFEVWQAV